MLDACVPLTQWPFSVLITSERIHCIEARKRMGLHFGVEAGFSVVLAQGVCILKTTMRDAKCKTFVSPIAWAQACHLRINPNPYQGRLVPLRNGSAIEVSAPP